MGLHLVGDGVQNNQSQPRLTVYYFNVSSAEQQTEMLNEFYANNRAW